MGFAVNFDHSRRIITMSFTGRVDYATLIGHITSLMRHAEYDKDYDGICDTRAAQLELSYDDLIRFRAWLETQNKDGKARGRWAIVAESNLNFGTSRMWEGLSSGYYRDLQVFKNEEDARKWLQSTPEQEG